MTRCRASATAVPSDSMRREQALLRRRRVDPGHQDRHVVVGAVGQHRRDQLLGDAVDRADQLGDVLGQRLDAEVEVLAAPLDETVGVEHHAGVRLEVDLVLGEVERADAERGVLLRRPTTRHSPAGDRDDRRQVAGVGEPQAPGPPGRTRRRCR